MPNIVQTFSLISRFEFSKFFNHIGGFQNWAISEKKTPTKLGGGVEDIEFPGLLRKEHVEILGVN